MKPNQVGRKLVDTLRTFVLCKPVRDGNVFSLNSAKLAHLLPERLQEASVPRKSA
jgi:hypothetical protein